MVSHPNYSGFQQDQLTQLWIPAHYVRRIELSLGGREILSFDGDISISENPTFRFFVKPQGSDVLHARVVDSEDKVFERGGQRQELAQRIPAQIVFGRELLHVLGRRAAGAGLEQAAAGPRSEEHTSELQSLMRTS